MIIKDGFLLIELMIGIALTTMLLIIIAHYIIEIKNIQQEAILRIEALSLARNTMEQINAHKLVNNVNVSSKKNYMLHVTQESLDTELCINKISVLWKVNKQDRAMNIYFNAQKKHNE